MTWVLYSGGNLTSVLAFHSQYSPLEARKISGFLKSLLTFTLDILCLKKVWLLHFTPRLQISCTSFSKLIIRHTHFSSHSRFCIRWCRPWLSWQNRKRPVWSNLKPWASPACLDHSRSLAWTVSSLCFPGSGLSWPPVMSAGCCNWVYERNVPLWWGSR